MKWPLQTKRKAHTKNAVVLLFLSFICRCQKTCCTAFFYNRQWNKSLFAAFCIFCIYLIDCCTLGDSGVFWTSRYQGIVKITVSWVLDDLTFKISKGSDQNWSCPHFSWDSQQGRLRTTSILVWAFWNFKHKVLKYSRNCSLHNTLIPNLVKPLIVCTLQSPNG